MFIPHSFLLLGPLPPLPLVDHFGYECGGRDVQSGVCGNEVDGACSIVVSGTAATGCEHEKNRLLYDLKTSNGAKALYKRMQKNLPVRVFRSSKLKGPLKAQPIRVGKKTRPSYRYDGLHKVNYCEHVGQYFRFCLVPLPPQELQPRSI